VLGLGSLETCSKVPEWRQGSEHFPCARLWLSMLEFVKIPGRLAPNLKNRADYGVHKLLLIGLAHLLAAAGLAQHYPILPVPGSPLGIYTLFQDSRSALWLGTANDVLGFDGTRFYSLRAFGFPREVPVSFADDGDGGLWIATQSSAALGGNAHGGLYRYQAGHVTRVLAGDAMTVVAVAPGIVAASMGIETGGRPAFGDLYLLRRFSSGPFGGSPRWTAQRMLDKQVNHLTVDHQGNLLFPCPGGWCQIGGRQLADWQGPGAKPEVERHAGSPLLQRVIRDKFSCLWFRAEQFASYQCPADLEPRALPVTIASHDSGALLEEAADGSILMGVPLALGRPGSFHTATETNGLPKALDTAMVARDGTIWIGAEGGLFRFMHPFQIESWGAADGVEVSTSTSLLRDGENIFATAGKNGGVLNLDQGIGRWNPLAGSAGLTGDLAVGPDHSLMVATSSSLTELRPSSGVVAKLPLPERTTFSLASSQKGDLWLAHGGISQVATLGNRLALHPEPGVADQALASAFFYDGAHRTLWACDGNDVLFHRDEAANEPWGHISPQNGLPSLRCGSIAAQANGDIWVGHDGGVLSMIGNPTSAHPAVANYSPWQGQVVVGNNYSHFLSIDSRGWIWMGKEALYLSALQTGPQPNWLRLDQQDGIAPTLNRDHSFLQAGDGSVWIATATEITHFLPPQDFATLIPKPSAFVSGFTFGQGNPVLADALPDVQGNAGVVAHIGSLQFDRRSAVHLRYRLSDHSAWTDSANFDLDLGKPGWGRHTLEVQAQMATGPWSEVEAASFDIPWPVWLSWPALTGYASAGGIFTLGARRWRRKRRARLKKAFPALAEWRLAALSPEMNQLDGALLDARFQVGRILARGGFAVVAEGRDLQQDGKRCAIKIFRKELVDKEWMKRRFDQEVLALGQIDHPNVVRILGSGTLPSDTLYLAMEFVDGATLRELLDKGKFDALSVASYLRQAGRALDEIHSHGICHRDLKPENLMIRSGAAREQDLVLIDFSIAIVKDPDETLHGLSRAAGTIYYMAPEQAIGFANSSTDIYSLAKILIEMLTGERLSTLLPDASMDLPDRVRELLMRLPLGLSSASIELIASALVFDPAHRPKNAGAFANQIASDLESGAAA
jgi:tRNA A-37 threonylcarbamoyl transferase component Bud32/ligand-binding sensor domain-containing protein